MDRTTFVYFTFEDRYRLLIGDEPIARDYTTIYDGAEYGKRLIDNWSNIMILLSSSRASDYHQFKKANCKRLYMNPWSRLESLDFAEKCNIQCEDLLQRFNLVGGVPRYVHLICIIFVSNSKLFSHLFGDVDSSRLFTQLQMAIPDDFAGLKKDVWHLILDSPLGCEILAHLPYSIWRRLDSTSEYFSLEYSSRIAEVLISTKFDIQSREELLRMSKTPGEDLNTWRGHQLENIMLCDLSLGKNQYRSRPLEKAQPDDFDLPVINSDWGAIRSEPIRAVSEIQDGEGNCMYLPFSTDFPAIDGLVILDAPGIILYIQCTVPFPIFYPKLKNLYQKLHEKFPGHKHAFAFCVSKDCYDDFQLQTFRTEDGGFLTAPRDIPVRQYVLGYE
jgi:hypothetical protein